MIARTSAWRALGAASLFAVVVVGVIGLLHMPMARPLLGLLGRATRAVGATCPLGFDRPVDEAMKQARRRQFAAQHAGQAMAQSRPARNFVLDHTTRAEISAWAEAEHLTCRSGRAIELDCSMAPGSLWFTFDESDRLVELVAVRRFADAAQVSAELDARAEDLARRVGESTRVEGDASPAVLGHGLLRQASREFRFLDYYALLRATNMGDGFVLTEEYRSLVR